jgi:hypothetical protein
MDENTILDPTAIKVQLNELEEIFSQLNSQHQEIYAEKLNQLLTLEKNLYEHVKKLEIIIPVELNKKRDSLIVCLKEYLINELENNIFANCNGECYSKNFSVFKKSFKNLNRSHLGHFHYLKPFNLLKKLKYLKYLDQFEELLNIDNKELNDFYVRFVVLSTKKIFVYKKASNDSFQLKIVDYLNVEVCRKKCNSSYIYRGIVGYSNKIICLLFSSDTSEFLLYVFDDCLNQLAIKKFNYDLHLCSANSNEIICWSWRSKQCLVFDFALNLIKTYGQETNKDAAFYFSNGMLLDVSVERILFYDFDETNKKQFIKILDRENGKLCGTIDFQFDYFSKMIRIDSHSNIILKLYEPFNVLKYYDLNGNLLFESFNQDFVKFARIDLTSDDTLICLDNANNKVFYL